MKTCIAECPAGPLIIHLIRHAESEHKPRGYSEAQEDIRDPKLNEAGRKHCIERAKHLRPQAKYITHILASPLSRTLETACLTFPDVIHRGVKVLAIPELQSLSTAPCSTGMDLDELKEIYCEDDSFGSDLFQPCRKLNCECLMHAKILKVKTPKAPDRKQAIQETKDDGKEDDQDTNQRHGLENDRNKFRGMVDLRHMEADWNRKAIGRWSRDHKEWRTKYLKNFMKAVYCARNYKRTEIVVVGHSSSLENLISGLSSFDNRGLDFDTYTFNKSKELERMSGDIVTQARMRDEIAERRQVVSEVSTPDVLVVKNLDHIESHALEDSKPHGPMSDNEIVRARKKRKTKSLKDIIEIQSINLEFFESSSSKALLQLKKKPRTEEPKESRLADVPSL